MSFLERLFGKKPEQPPLPKLLLSPDSLRQKFAEAIPVRLVEPREAAQNPTYRLASRQIELVNTPIHRRQGDTLFAYPHFTPLSGPERVTVLDDNQPQNDILPERTFRLKLPQEAYWQEGKAVLYIEAAPHQWVVSGVSVPKSIFIRSKFE